MICVFINVYIYVIYILSYHDTESSIYNPSMLKKKVCPTMRSSSKMSFGENDVLNSLGSSPKKSNAGDVDVLL